MSVILGSGVFNAQGNTFQIAPPTGFGAVSAMRLSNYTGDVLILKNIVGDGSDQQYLMPYQQAVYPFSNTRAIPTMTGLGLGSGVNPEALLVEWSTEPDVDFPGTYPAPLTVAPFLTSTQIFTQTVTLAGSATHSVAATVASQRTVVNNGAGNLYISPTPFVDAAHSFLLAADASLTIPNGGGFDVTADATGASFSLIADHA